MQYESNFSRSIPLPHFPSRKDPEDWTVGSDLGPQIARINKQISGGYFGSRFDGYSEIAYGACSPDTNPGASDDFLLECVTHFLANN